MYNVQIKTNHTLEIGYPVYGKPKELKEPLDEMVEEVRKLQPEYIIGSGTSGVAIGTYIALQLGIPYKNVDKESDKHHFHYDQPSKQNITRGVIVDDMIDTGHTMLRIWNDITENGDHPERVIHAVVLSASPSDVMPMKTLALYNGII